MDDSQYVVQKGEEIKDFVQVNLDYVIKASAELIRAFHLLRTMAYSVLFL